MKPFRLAIGSISGSVQGYQMAREQKISPWTGEKTQLHHAVPKFIGGNDRQELVPMSASRHRDLHQEMYEYLDGYGMRPKKGNSKDVIEDKFGKCYLMNTMRSFYDCYPVKYYDARYYYYKNRGILKEWRPF